MKIAAAYIRVSSDRQDEFSPDSQLKLIRDFCKKNDMELPDEFIFYDDGISGKNAKKRKQFNDMIALAKQKTPPFSVILVWKFSRFARNQEESIVYKSLLRKNGVDVISVSEPLIDNPFGGLIERIIEWMDEYYLIRLGDEVRRGMTERATRGKPNTYAPFGYKMNKESGEYKIDEKNAPIVRYIFDQYKSTRNMRQITIALRDMGIRTRFGNIMDNRMVEYILRNPVYKGYLRWNPFGKSSSARKWDNPSDILEKASHEPIIPEEEFNAVQELLREDKERHIKFKHTNARHEYMLRGLIRCSSCGSTLVYSPCNKGLQCHRYSRGQCATSHYIKEEFANRLVIDELKRCVDTLSFTIDPAVLASKESAKDVHIDFEKLIQAEHLKLDRAKQAYQEGIDSLAEYKKTKEKILATIQGIEDRRKECHTEHGIVDYKKLSKAVAGAIKMLENETVSGKAKNEILCSFVEKIIFYRTEKRVEIFFHL